MTTIKFEGKEYTLKMEPYRAECDETYSALVEGEKGESYCMEWPVKDNIDYCECDFKNPISVKKVIFPGE